MNSAFLKTSPSPPADAIRLQFILGNPPGTLGVHEVFDHLAANSYGVGQSEEYVDYDLSEHFSHQLPEMFRKHQINSVDEALHSRAFLQEVHAFIDRAQKTYETPESREGTLEKRAAYPPGKKRWIGQRRP